MRPVQASLVLLAASFTGDVEFLLTTGKAVSLSQQHGVLNIGTRFDLETIRTALPGYEVRFLSAEEQDRLGKGYGAEGAGEDVFLVSKGGTELLEVFGDMSKIHVIYGVARVIDGSGVRVGSSLKAAFIAKTTQCWSHEGVYCAAEQPNTTYSVGGPDDCYYDANLSGGDTLVETTAFLDCAVIRAISIH